VSDVQCTFGTNNAVDTHKHHSLTATRDTIAARLRKPEGFRGSPIFADDRQVDPLTDVSCQIRPDSTDTEELTYDLLITDFSKCGVLKRNVRICRLPNLLLSSHFYVLRSILPHGHGFLIAFLSFKFSPLLLRTLFVICKS
jgi:hypothetical protein